MMWIEGTLEQVVWLAAGLGVVVALYLIVSGFTNWIR